ncbi:General transcription factor IIE subunit 1 [Exaiptasia diaphana]|nr:General transcription factor IIE subunit 1 [Exaiptasia diaphana]
MNGVMDEPALLLEVPPVLKRLAKLVVRGFYEDEHVALVNVLTNAKHPCVKEEDLMELLKFDKRQLRQVIMRLKNDKLIKQRVHKEKQPDTGTMLTFNYYFINYKLFVNVVRYKLDHIRKKIESDEKQAKNRPSFLCTQCANKYSDLEVDRLIDMMTGLLKCTYCSGTVEEDVSEIQQESENINLAPQILEPEPDLSSINVQASRASHGTHASKSGWAHDRRGIDTGDLGIKISMGPEDDNDSDKTKRVKDAPIWMQQSTVAPNEETKNENNPTTNTSTGPQTSAHKEDEILADLLAHESVSKKPRLDVEQALGKEESESSDDSDDEEMKTIPVSQDDKVTEAMEEADSDGDNEIKIKIGGKLVALHDVKGDMIESMTQEEHDAYDKACKEAYSDMF